MSFKLNITPPDTQEVQEQKLIIKATGYETPLAWWKCETEGDCEDRGPRRQLGTHYGHVAEIALFLADKAEYEIIFEPVFNLEIPTKRKVFKASRDKVYIGFEYKSPFYNMGNTERVTNVAKWFNTEDVKIKEGNYWKSVLIELK